MKDFFPTHFDRPVIIENDTSQPQQISFISQFLSTRKDLFHAIPSLTATIVLYPSFRQSISWICHLEQLHLIRLFLCSNNCSLSVGRLFYLDAELIWCLFPGTMHRNNIRYSCQRLCSRPKVRYLLIQLIPPNSLIPEIFKPLSHEKLQCLKHSSIQLKRLHLLSTSKY